MKKIVALALAVVMVLGLMAGCEKAMDVKTLTQKMDEANKNVTTMAGKAAMDMDLTMGVTGITMELGMALTMDMKMNSETGESFTDAKITMDMMGESETMEMELYSVLKDGEIVAYTHDKTTDTWVYQVEGAELDPSVLTSSSITFAEIPVEKMTLAPEKQTVGGKECYVLTADMDGSNINGSLEEFLGAMNGEMDETTKSMIENLDLSAIKCHGVYYVDAATFLAVQMDLEITGVGDAVNSLLSGAMGEMLLGGDPEGLGLTIEVPTFHVTMTDIVYEGVEIPAVPQEGIDNAIDADAVLEEEQIDEIVDPEMINNPPQEDGRYQLVLGEQVINVAVPEGCIAYATEAEMLMFLSDDFTTAITYAIAPGATAEDIKLEMDATVEYYQSENFYKSHTVGEPINGYEVMTIVFDDAYRSTYAWIEVGTGVLMINIESETEVTNLEELISAIEIAG